jgi:ribose transport system permease protein
MDQDRVNPIRELLKNRSVFLGVTILVITVTASFFYDAPGTTGNMKAIWLNISADVVVAIGMMILLVSGAFDLSVGSVFGLSGAIAGNLMYFHQVNWALAILIALLVCVGIGAFTGGVVAKLGANPLIVTLAMMGLIRGMVLLIAGTGITVLPDEFVAISDQVFLGIRIPIWYMGIITVIFAFLLSKTLFFRRYYYIGANEKAANLSGMNIVKMRIISFMISAGLAGIAGIIVASRLTMAMSSLGTGVEIRVITACILGGASLTGGQGTILGVLLGTLLVGVINNLMVIARISTYWQNIVIGGILLIAVTIDAFLNRSRYE